jgi:RNA polymerase sigma factor (sigma-70 family)
VEGALAPEADFTRDLYEQYANQIFRYCLHQLGSREEAEDAVQSTFLNAFRGIKRGVVPELESAWLFKIAHNVCLSRRRSAWRRGRVESATDFEVVEELAPAPTRRADELIGLQDVLEQMPEAQRRAILLREWQGLSYHEIADELELSQAAVETLIFRARRSLASGLEQPPETTRRRAARALDLGNVAAGIKSVLLGGGAAAKVAATVAVVSATTVVATSPVQQHRRHASVPTPAAKAPVKRTAPRAKHVAVHTSAAAAAAAARPHAKKATVRHRLVRHAPPHRQKATVAASTTAPALTIDPGPPVEQPAAPAPAPQPTPAPAPAPQPTADTGTRSFDKPAQPAVPDVDSTKHDVVRTPSVLPVQISSVTDQPAAPPASVTANVSVDVSQPTSPAVSVTVNVNGGSQSPLDGSFNPVG